MRTTFQPAGRGLLASDDVFDEMLDTRAFNDGMDQRRETVFEEYLANKRSHFQLPRQYGGL